MKSAPYEGNGWYSQSSYIVPSENVHEFLSYEEYREWLAAQQSD